MLFIGKILVDSKVTALYNSSMSNASFIFMWDENGIEAVLPITRYEKWDQENTMRMLRGDSSIANPIDGHIRTMLLRARFNSQRAYEIYAIQCDKSMDEAFWWEQWDNNPQYTAELVREKGHRLFSNYNPTSTPKIV